MFKYSIGDKIVVNEDLEAAPGWFKDEYVIIKAVNEEDYTVEPVDNPMRDRSWVAVHEINHEATEQLNK